MRKARSVLVVRSTHNNSDFNVRCGRRNVGCEDPEPLPGYRTGIFLSSGVDVLPRALSRAVPRILMDRGIAKWGKYIGLVK